MTVLPWQQETERNLRSLLATDGTTAADSGFMRRFKELGDALLGVDGSFETRNESLQDRLERNGDRQDQMEARLAATDDDLDEGFGLLAMRARWQADVGPGRLELLGRVDNLADRRVAGSVIVNEGNQRFFEPAAGRTLLLSARWSQRF